MFGLCILKLATGGRPFQLAIFCLVETIGGTMFIGTLTSWDAEKKYLPDIFSQVTDFLKSIDPETIKPGTYPIQGNEIFAKVECGSGKSEAERRFELHHKYIDVQMLLTGHERQDVTTIPPSSPPHEDRLQEEDIAFYPAAGPIHSFYMHPGMFIIYFPGELHAPGLFDGNGKYKKVVVKIDIEIL